ncbi:hypothetical protein [Cyanobium sp. Lug-B]|uniref:hypothetical protein n=1 Tax=Cyanobium sp. Lug-B TaxID=2823716 RepID=UPI0020CEFBB0|nr:hypothetical protein [Cyanobium sp. Lug-B]MCP9796134.1 hypothetical protein [Cyanobium sp. Lug-B]
MYRVNLEELKEILNPLDGEMWKCGAIPESQILQAFSSNVTEHRSWEGDRVVAEVMTLEEARRYHVNRIATLMRQESQFDRIVLMLENHTENIKATLNDGNHRLAAAYVRGDDSIQAIIAASNPTGIFTILPRSVRIDNEDAAS